MDQRPPNATSKLHTHRHHLVLTYTIGIMVKIVTYTYPGKIHFIITSPSFVFDQNTTEFQFEQGHALQLSDSFFPPSESRVKAWSDYLPCRAMNTTHSSPTSIQVTRIISKTSPLGLSSSLIPQSAREENEEPVLTGSQDPLDLSLKSRALKNGPVCF